MSTSDSLSDVQPGADATASGSAATNTSDDDNGSGAVGQDQDHGSVLTEEEAQDFKLVDMNLAENAPPAFDDEDPIEDKIHALRRYVTHLLTQISEPGKFNKLLTFWSLKAQDAALARFERPYGSD